MSGSTEHVLRVESSINKKRVTRRQSRACDSCRRSKTRCDGTFPCSRCSATQRLCSFSDEVDRRKVRRLEEPTSPAQAPTVTPSNQLSPELTPWDGIVELNTSNSFLAGQALARSYIKIYFDRMYMIFKIMDIDTSRFERPTGKPILLQYYAAAASACRALDRKSVV